jgi:hypothetical protein
METKEKSKELKKLVNKVNIDKKINKEKVIQEISKIINKSMTRKYLEIYLK